MRNDSARRELANRKVVIADVKIVAGVDPHSRDSPKGRLRPCPILMPSHARAGEGRDHSLRSDLANAAVELVRDKNVTRMICGHSARLVEKRLVARSIPESVHARHPREGGHDRIRGNLAHGMVVVIDDIEIPLTVDCDIGWEIEARIASRSIVTSRHSGEAGDCGHSAIGSDFRIVELPESATKKLPALSEITP